MLFWIVAALLTVGACSSVLLPFLRQAPAGTPGGAHDLAVYKDQLAELERDQSRGLIGKAEAEQARTEIARRILRADETTSSASMTQSRAGRIMAMVAVLSVPLVSWGVYAATGSPDQPSQPLQARLENTPDDGSVEELVARAEAHLRSNPTDGRGWEVLAPIYLRIGRPNDALTAYRNAIQYSGSSATLEGGLGEAIVGVGGGVISTEAQAAFERALKARPGDGKARFYLAMAAAQDGRMDDARSGWQAMQADLPADSPWREASAQALAQASKIDAQPGPSAEDVASAEAMNPEDRGAMIEGMVASLDARLKENPKDVDGWQRLVRSYMVLNRPDDARAALARGLAALGNTTREAATLQDFATSINVAGNAQ